MYEYLAAAEQKKKFTVKIANRNNKGASLGKGLGLAPPKGMLASSKGVRAPPRSVSGDSLGIGLSLAPPPKEETKVFSLEPPKANAPALALQQTPSKQDEKSSYHGREPASSRSPPASNDAGFNNFGRFNQTSSLKHSEFAEDESETRHTDQVEASYNDGEGSDFEDDVAATLWDTATPLSQQLRPSAAGALIRGPPATRHYGESLTISLFDASWTILTIFFSRLNRRKPGWSTRLHRD
jgi:hypothetical protein